MDGFVEKENVPIFSKKIVMDKERIISLYNEGRSCRSIAMEVGCCTTTIGNILRREGIEVRSRVTYLKHEPISKETRAKMGRMLKRGMHYKVVAEKLGLSIRSVCKEKNRLGLVHKKDEELYATIKRMVDEGLTYAQIAKELNIDRVKVLSIASAIKKHEELLKRRFNAQHNS